MPYPVVDLAPWVILGQEWSGQDSKLWVTPPESVLARTGSDNWLWKPVKWGNAGVRGSVSRVPYRRFDDISEVVASALAELVELPAAEVLMATSPTVGDGVISRNVVPELCSLQSGDVLLSATPGYLSCQGASPPKNRVGHRLDVIEGALDGISGPPGAHENWTALEVFAGYLVFDAWIANTDRHAVNWGVLQAEGGRRWLSPSFDHGSALASGTTDAGLALDVAAYCAGGRASRFENGRGITLVDLARQAVLRAKGRSGEWIERLRDVTDAQIDEVLAEVPRVSVPRRKFLTELLTENRRRLTA